jgi:alkylation response protein AidB-like acyl-CoA dehydrogenase
MSVTAADRFRDLVARGELDLPDPGGGASGERLVALFELARLQPVSVARLAEAHTDALAILHEAGRQPDASALYGVWASAGPHDVRLVADAEGRLRLHGCKPFASGLGIVDRALVTVIDDRSGGQPGRLLVDVSVRGSEVAHRLDDWVCDALRDAATGAAEFTGHRLDVDDIVGGSGWYLDRVGFWHGACAPAACWAGAAAGLLDASEQLVDDDPHRRANLGAMRSTVWAMRSLLWAAGGQIDASPDDIEWARARAYALRSTVERLATDLLDRFGRAFGPRPFAHDAALSQRWSDTHLYLRQHHGERDLAAAGAGVWPSRSP